MALPASENLYRVFKPHRLGDDFVGCDHCVSVAASEKLAAIPLRKLTLSDLNSYAYKAMTTWGTDRHFKYFLPRLFDLAAEQPNDFTIVESLFGKLVYADWDQWPRVERQAIEDYLDELWDFTLSRPIESENNEIADTVLCCIGQTRVDISRFLDHWLESNSEFGLLHLSAFVSLNVEMVLRKEKLFNAFWNNSLEQAEVVRKWLRSQELRDYLHSHESKLTEGFRNALWVIETLSDRADGNCS